MLTMKTTKVAATLSMMLVLQSTMAVALSLGMYRSCLYECLNCVNTWGKDLFKGQECADNCAITGGSSIDRTCASFSRSSRGVRPGRQYLHSEDLKGPSRAFSFSSSSSRALRAGVPAYRSRRPRFGMPAARSSFGALRSFLSSDCQRQCRKCESSFSFSMDAHSCRYTCVRTNRRVVAC